MRWLTFEPHLCCVILAVKSIWMIQRTLLIGG